jgi:hypothetical protein
MLQIIRLRPEGRLAGIHEMGLSTQKSNANMSGHGTTMIFESPIGSARREPKPLHRVSRRGLHPSIR